MFSSLFQALAVLVGVPLVGGVVITLLLLFMIYGFDNVSGSSERKEVLSYTPPTAAQFVTKRDPLPQVEVKAFLPRKVDANGMQIIDQAQIDAIKAKIEAQKNIPTYQAEFEIIE